jgi:hypothetical protein
MRWLRWPAVDVFGSAVAHLLPRQIKRRLQPSATPPRAVLDVLVPTRLDAGAARAFFAAALRLGPAPIEVVTDRAPV